MIVKFSDSEHRQRFLELVEQERPDIKVLMREQYNLPNITIRRVNDEQARWIADHVEPFGRAYGDVQFQAM
ncbi:MAG: hypothetical protein ACFB22_06495 [Rhodothalassiaceae bacterium]